MASKPGNGLTVAQAQQKAGRYCAYQERCQQEVREKLYSLKLHRGQVEEVLAYLITEGYVNEERFAKVYAGGKFRIKKWGKIKIMNALKTKNISDYCIQKALEEIDSAEYVGAIDEIISKRDKPDAETDIFIRRNKIAKFLIGKGFEPELVWEQVKMRLPAQARTS